jgi:hypothetical protein
MRFMPVERGGSRAAGQAGARILWRPGQDPTAADLLLAGLGDFWTSRRGQQSDPGWRIHHRPAAIADMTAVEGASQVWQPSVELGSVLVSAYRLGRLRMLSSWQPFPSAEHARMHMKSWQCDRSPLSWSASEVRQGAAALGLPSPASWTPSDPGYWIAGSPLMLVRAAIGVQAWAHVPLELAGRALLRAGFVDLSPDAAEVAAGLAEGWDQTIPDLVEAAALLAGTGT